MVTQALVVFFLKRNDELLVVSPKVFVILVEDLM